jgi:uncharacterized delta-60 repeat protein
MTSSGDRRLREEAWRQRWRLRGAIALCAVTLVMCGAQAWATDGVLDPSFSDNGRALVDFGNGDADGAFDLAIQPDGRIVAIGYSNRGASGYDFAIVRLNPDGGLDQTFSSDGRQTINFGRASDDWGHGVTIERDGGIVVCGGTGVGGGVGLARLGPDGELDPSFSGDGRRTVSFARRAIGSARTVEIAARGKIVVSGESFSGEGSLNPAVARFHPDGSLDRSFSGDGRLTMKGHRGGRINSLSTASGGGMAIQRDGKVDVAVEGVLDKRQPTLDIARFGAKGKPDRSFSEDGRRTIGPALTAYSGDPALAIQPDGRILASGYLGRHRSLVARLKTDGTLDHSFSTNGRQRVSLGVGNDLALQDHGEIVLVGKDRGFAVARLRATGSLDRSFSEDGRARIGFARRAAAAFGVVVRGDKIVVGGFARRDSTQLDFALARLKAN